MSIAVKFTGPGKNEAKPFFLCIHKEPGQKNRDEWCENEAEEFANELSAEIACHAIGLGEYNYEFVNYPKQFRSKKAAQKQKPELAQYRTKQK